MIIQPKIRRNICINAHPAGCAAQVKAQIHHVRSRGGLEGPKRVLVVGATNGYGLAARIVSAFGSGAATIGIGLEKAGTANRTGTAGWYNAEAFRVEAERAGLGAWNLNADAFSEAAKAETADLIRTHLGAVDLLVYSIAAPRRIDPETGAVHTSVIKPIGAPFTAKSVDFATGRVEAVTTPPATPEEIAHTVKVMGGEDWALWIRRLMDEKLLEPGCLTMAFSYIGSEFTRPLYRDGTIGAAKKDLERKTAQIQRMLTDLGGRALISVNKALITRASAVIPAVPLYIALLYKVMKEKGLHEGCIHQMDRLYRDFLFSGKPVPTDEQGRVRLDDWELRPDVQQAIGERWAAAETDTLPDMADLAGMRAEFLRHHGFGMPGVDYDADVPADRV